jgi:GNAT superfamily N-acetyltransferase
VVRAFAAAVEQLKSGGVDREIAVGTHMLVYKAVAPSDRQRRKRGGDFSLRIAGGGRLKSERAMREFVEQEEARCLRNSEQAPQSGPSEAPDRQRGPDAHRVACDDQWRVLAVSGAACGRIAAAFACRLPADEAALVESARLSGNLALVAVPAAEPTPRSETLIAARAGCVLCCRVSRVDTAPTKGLSVPCNVSLECVVTAAASRRRGLASMLIEVLRTIVRPGRTLWVDKPACQVGAALRLWQAAGLRLAGADGHPLPDPGSKGRHMPAVAERRTLFSEVVAMPWTCAACSARSKHGTRLCASCGARRVPDLETVTL